jgi:hypothetical protein
MAELSLIKKLILGLALAGVTWLNLNIYNSVKIDEDTELSYTSISVEKWEKQISPDQDNEGLRYIIQSSTDREYIIEAGVSECLDREYFDFVGVGDMLSIGQLKEQGILGWFSVDEQVYQVINDSKKLIDLECVDDRSKSLKWLVPAISATFIFILFTLLRRRKKKLSS